MTTPVGDKVTRTVTSFDARSRQILTNGGTVKGGNGITYKYDPLTGMAVNANAGARTAAPAARPAGAAPGPNSTVSAIEQAAAALPGGAAPATPLGASTPSFTEIQPDPLGEGNNPDSERQNDARARINSVLGEYGLESLADFVWQQILSGKSDAEVLQDIRNTPQFKERFPAIAERTAKGLAPISPGEYVAYERQARQIMRAAGLPESFYDGRDDFTRFLSADVSVSELNDRIQLGRRAAYEAPAEVREALMNDYGLTEGGLTAYFLDPTRAQPLLEKQYAASQIGGAGRRTGFGSTRAENERLVELGVTAEQAQQGFGTLVDSKELFGSLDRGEDEIGRDEQLGAAFGGNANAQRRIEQRRRKRQATFQQGGQFASGQQGVSGLGSTTN